MNSKGKEHIAKKILKAIKNEKKSDPITMDKED
jgi:hypothetical protein